MAAPGAANQQDESQMAKLVFIGEHLGGRIYQLVVEKTTVGRADHNTLTIHDKSVSSHHCEILVNGPEVIVHDLGSANGTFVDDVRVNKQCQVKSGHIIRFGSVEARLELEPETSTDHATDLTAHYALEQYQRDQRRKQNKPAEIISATIDVPSQSDPGDHTVMMPKPPEPVAAPKPLEPAPAPGPRPGARPKAGLVLGIAAVLVLGLLVVFWLWWKGK
jgi:predicted component of type VI protein secretion system